MRNKITTAIVEEAKFPLSLKLPMNRGKSKYCIVLVYKTKRQMQVAYKKQYPHCTFHFRTLGVHCGYHLAYVDKNGRMRQKNETGTILLSLEYCGAGIVTHEIMHGILWARKNGFKKQQYPIVIKTMEEEENILQDFTYAVQFFYNWYWKIDKGEVIAQ